jgi:hypothetical protein
MPHNVSAERKKLSLLEWKFKWTSNPFQRQLSVESHHMLAWT